MVASRDADGGRAQKSKREGAYFFLVAFFFVAFFTVFFGADFTAFFFAAFAAIVVTLASLSPFEMFGLRALTARAQPNDPERSFLCDERRHGPCLLRATLAPEPDAGARATPGHPVRLGPATIAVHLFAASAAHAERGLRRRNAGQGPTPDCPAARSQRGARRAQCTQRRGST